MVSSYVGIDSINVPQLFARLYGIQNMDFVFITYNYLLNGIEKLRWKQHELKCKT